MHELRLTSESDQGQILGSFCGGAAVRLILKVWHGSTLLGDCSEQGKTRTTPYDRAGTRGTYTCTRLCVVTDALNVPAYVTCRPSKASVSCSSSSLGFCPAKRIRSNLHCNDAYRL